MLFCYKDIILYNSNCVLLCYFRRLRESEFTGDVVYNNLKCGATVKQYKDLFTPGINGHQHQPEPGALKKTKIAAKVRFHNRFKTILIMLIMPI
jgi:hypothetical protein